MAKKKTESNNGHNRQRDVQLLRTVPFFSGMTDAELNDFLTHAHHEVVPKGRQLFQYGESAEQFYVVLDGWVKIYRVNKEGEETVISLLSMRDAFSEVATFERSDYPYSAQVVGGEAEFLVIPASVIRQKVRESPGIALRMLASMSRHADQLSLAFEHITKLTTAQRVGCFLLKLSMDCRYEAKLRLPYSKYLLASQLGMQAETFSRALTRLSEDLGITVDGRDVTIPDIEALLEYCEIHCFYSEPCSPEKRLLCTTPQCDIFRILTLM